MTVDFGRRGLATCTADVAAWPMTVRGLTVDTDTGAICNAQLCAHAAQTLVDGIRERNVHAYVLEAQPAINRKTCMFEAGTVGYLLGRGVAAANIVSLSPKVVQHEFALPVGHVPKKHAATRLAKRLLGAQTELRVADATLDAWHGAARQHDMADALLMALYYARALHGRLVHRSRNPLARLGKQKKRRVVKK